MCWSLLSTRIRPCPHLSLTKLTGLLQSKLGAPSALLTSNSRVESAWLLSVRGRHPALYLHAHQNFAPEICLHARGTMIGVETPGLIRCCNDDRWSAIRRRGICASDEVDRSRTDCAHAYSWLVGNLIVRRILSYRKPRQLRVPPLLEERSRRCDSTQLG